MPAKAPKQETLSKKIGVSLGLILIGAIGTYIGGVMLNQFPNPFKPAVPKVPPIGISRSLLPTPRMLAIPAPIVHKLNSMHAPYGFKLGHHLRYSGSALGQSDQFSMDENWDATPKLAPDDVVKASDPPKLRQIKIQNNHVNKLIRSGHLAQAAVEERAIFPMAVNYANAHNTRGTLLLKRGQYDKSSDEFRAALLLDPTNPIYNTNYARSLIKVGLVVLPLHTVPNPKFQEHFSRSNKNPFFPRTNGIFVVADRVKGPIYDLAMQDGFAGVKVPPGYLGSESGNDNYPVMPKNTIVLYYPKRPDLLRNVALSTSEFDVYLRYKEVANGPPKISVFRFVSRQDSAGAWRWYPKL